MSKTIEVADGQNLHDICLQHYGSYDGLLDLIERNASITSVDFEPPTGMELEIGDSIDEDIVNYYIRENVVIVSNREKETEFDDGIFAAQFGKEFA